MAQQATQINTAGGIYRVEVEARVKGTTEWINLNLSGDVTTGELKAFLVYLAKEGEIIPEGTEIELRAYYYVQQDGQAEIKSSYSKVIGFGSDDIYVEPTQPQEGVGDDVVNEPTNKHKCPICGFCPEPLGLCIFIWLVIILVVLAILFVVYKVVKKNKEKKENNK